jgi:hypothetical protein
VRKENKSAGGAAEAVVEYGVPMVKRGEESKDQRAVVRARL